jgi:dienelactone hydrolase
MVSSAVRLARQAGLFAATFAASVGVHQAVDVAAEAQVAACPDFIPPRDTAGNLAKAYTWQAYEAPRPGEIGTKAHGTITGCYHLAQAIVREATGMANAADAVMTRHVTQDTAGQKQLASSVLFLSTLNAGRDLPVVVLNTATIGIDAHCGASVQALSKESTLLVRDKVDRFLRDGYNVLVPDYVGHGIRGQDPHPYVEGRSEAYAVLDAISAARALPSAYARMYKTGGALARLALQGYSQGAHVTAFTMQLAPSYAPSVSFAAIRAGGVPVNLEVSLGNAIEAFEAGGSDSGFTALAIVAMLYSHDPEVRMTWSELAPYITDSADVSYWANYARNECRGQQQIADFFSGLKRESFDGLGFLEHPKVKRFLVRNSLTGRLASSLFTGTQVAVEAAKELKLARPSAPFMLYGSPGDTVAPAAEVRTLMAGWAGPAIAESSRVWGYMDMPFASQVWGNTTGAHGLDESDLYWTVFAASRYTPDEWLATYMK